VPTFPACPLNPAAFRLNLILDFLTIDARFLS
jgi:hypothetical protein